MEPIVKFRIYPEEVVTGFREEFRKGLKWIFLFSLLMIGWLCY